MKYEATSLGDAQVIALEALEPRTGNKYTVTLLYPDYVADNFGQDVYVAHVEADWPGGAISIAREKVGATVPDVENLEDFHVVSVFEGHLEDLQ